MTTVNPVVLKTGREPAWDDAMRQRLILDLRK